MSCALNRDALKLELSALTRNKIRKERGLKRAAGDEQETSGLTTSKPKAIVDAEDVAWKKI